MTMRPTRSCLLLPLALAVLALSACGGGGGGKDSPVATGNVPSSGSYTWGLKAQGLTSALKYGLSLVHPDQPQVEYVVEYGSSVLTDVHLIAQASLDAAGGKANGVTPTALVYIVGGDVRLVPLQANGTLPANQVTRAQSTTACEFLLDKDGNPVGDALDYGTPANSRLLVLTAGADGLCGSSDDGAAELRIGAANALTFTPLAARPLGYVRDAKTLAPAAWVNARDLTLWSGSVVTTRSASRTAFTGVVAAAPQALLMDDGNQLSVLDVSTLAAPAETLLNAATTGGGGWVGIGYDASAFYAYRNSGNSPSGTWKLVRISRSSPAATTLAQGSGLLSVASMGNTLVYATVVGTGGNQLLSVSKTGGVPVTVLENTASSTLTTVQTSANGVHELWRVLNIGTASLGYQIELVDEAGAKLYSTSAGGFPLATPDATDIDFNRSENRTRFVFASGYGARAFGDASLVGYDTASKTATTFGTLPGSTDFATDLVYTNVIAGPGNFMTAFSARSAGGSIQTAGAKLQSFRFGQATSLTTTSTSQ